MCNLERTYHVPGNLDLGQPIVSHILIQFGESRTSSDIQAEIANNPQGIKKKIVMPRQDGIISVKR